MNKKHPDILVKTAFKEHLSIPDHCLSCISLILGKYVQNQKIRLELKDVPEHIEEIENSDLLRRFERENCHSCAESKKHGK